MSGPREAVGAAKARYRLAEAMMIVKNFIFPN
jgi:hypothetical protein